MLCGQLAHSQSTGGGMVLNRAIVVFKPGEPPREDVGVLNQDNENLYLAIDIVEVRNPGTEQEERIAATPPSLPMLVATPNRLIVPPQGRKTIRLVNREVTDEERIYRVNVTPKLPPLQNPEKSMIRVILAHQLLVIVQPRQPVENLQVTRQELALVFENQGNTNVMISEGEQCDAAGESCVELPVKRLYAGNRLVVPLVYDTPVRYKLTANDVTRQVVYE